MDTRLKIFTDEEVSEYREIVNEIAKKRDNKLVISPTDKHAAIIFKNLLEQASREVLIYDKDLSGDLLKLESGSLDLLKSKVSKNIKFLFIVDSKEEILHELTPVLGFENVSFIVADDHFKKTVREKLGNDYYFAVVDGSMFRLEFKDGSRNAICSFNDKTYSQNIIEVFNSCKELA